MCPVTAEKRCPQNVADILWKAGHSKERRGGGDSSRGEAGEREDRPQGGRCCQDTGERGPAWPLGPVAGAADEGNHRVAVSAGATELGPCSDLPVPPSSDHRRALR